MLLFFKVGPTGAHLTQAQATRHFSSEPPLPREWEAAVFPH